MKWLKRHRRRRYAKWYRTAGMTHRDAISIYQRIKVKNPGLDGVLFVRYMRCARQCQNYALSPSRRKQELRGKRWNRREFLRQVRLTKRL